jgi:hypothetical protein
MEYSEDENSLAKKFNRAILKWTLPMFLDLLPFSAVTLTVIKESGLDRRLNLLLDRESPESIDARIKKIDAARDNLFDALSAMDDLKRMATENQEELTSLQTAIKAASEEKEGLAKHNDNLKKLSEIEVGSIRTALGIPTRSQVRLGYFVSFIVGLVTTQLFTFVYDFIAKPAFTHFFPDFSLW